MRRWRSSLPSHRHRRRSARSALQVVLFAHQLDQAQLLFQLGRYDEAARVQDVDDDAEVLVNRSAALMLAGDAAAALI